MIEQYTKQVDDAVARFRKDVDKLKKSDDPRFQGDDVIQYETNKLREILEKEVAQANADFEQSIKSAVKDAEEKAAKSYFYVGETNKNIVEHHLDTFVSDVAFAITDADKAKALEKLENKFDYMDSAQLDYVRKRLPDVLQKVGNDKKTVRNLRHVNNTLSALKTPEVERLEELKAEASEIPDMAYKRLTMTHIAFSDKPKNAHNLK